MFYTQKIFDELAHGKLSQMAIGNSIHGSIKQDKYTQIISSMNAALRDLHIRFVLKKKEFLLHQQAGVSNYYLRPSHIGDPANVEDPEIYLEDPEGNLADRDIIKILSAFLADGTELYINDARYPDDIFMPQNDVIKITPRDPLEIISIEYQAEHTDIVIGADFDPKTHELFFPTYLIEPVKLYITSQLFVGKTSNPQEGQPSIASTFMFKYEQACQDITNRSLVPQVDEVQQQFELGGWA